MRPFIIRTRQPVRPLVVALCIAAAMLSASAVSAQTAVASAPNGEQLKDATWIAAGRDKFVHTCGYCHGQEGDAGKTRPFRERVDWDPQLIFDTISNGRQRGANIMPAWGGSIPEDDIWRIVAFIKSLEGKPRATQ